jgi:cell division protein FtsB
MKREKIKLKNDLDYVEKVARERLGMIKENELLFRFSEKEVSVEE